MNNIQDSLKDSIKKFDQLDLAIDRYQDAYPEALWDAINKSIDGLSKVQRDAQELPPALHVPVDVLKMLDVTDRSNPEYYAQDQLEKCQRVSSLTSQQRDAVRVMRDSLKGVETMEVDVSDEAEVNETPSSLIQELP